MSKYLADAEDWDGNAIYCRIEWDDPQWQCIKVVIDGFPDPIRMNEANARQLAALLVNRADLLARLMAVSELGDAAA